MKPNMKRVRLKCQKSEMMTKFHPFKMQIFNFIIIIIIIIFVCWGINGV